MVNPETSPARAAARQAAEDAALAACFEAARGEPQALPDGFLAAVLEDAARVQAQRSRPRPAAAAPDGWSWLGGLLRPFGGWPVATGLAGCLAVGLMAGQTDPVARIVASTLWSDAVALEGLATGVDGFFDLAASEG